MTTISPGSISRSSSASMRSSAVVSLAMTYAFFTRPSTSGRNPMLSRTATSFFSVKNTIELAPFNCLSASTTRASKAPARLRAMKWMTFSVSLSL